MASVFDAFLMGVSTLTRNGMRNPVPDAAITPLMSAWDAAKSAKAYQHRRTSQNPFGSSRRAAIETTTGHEFSAACRAKRARSCPRITPLSR
ncbi:hypothetical protein CYJ10_17235 [Cupriavidus pauculus]|uniref:Uncharacterized protein n=1 Tax=Cupriavidus pauculus TaxID=82633 RepID=A0A2N5CBH4_9BURK|nr:hypothetical protein CYJ10_17235 [Cupriavidus pauculus]